MKAVGFKGILRDRIVVQLGDKSRTGSRQGMEKVRHVCEQVNMILEYIPYIRRTCSRPGLAMRDRSRSS